MNEAISGRAVQLMSASRENQRNADFEIAAWAEADPTVLLEFGQQLLGRPVGVATFCEAAEECWQKDEVCE